MSRKTPQREAIREAIEAADRPLSPQEILELAQRAVPQLGIATVRPGGARVHSADAPRHRL